MTMDDERKATEWTREVEPTEYFARRPTHKTSSTFRAAIGRVLTENEREMNLRTSRTEIQNTYTHIENKNREKRRVV